MHMAYCVLLGFRAMPLVGTFLLHIDTVLETCTTDATIVTTLEQKTKTKQNYPLKSLNGLSPVIQT